MVGVKSKKIELCSTTYTKSEQQEEKKILPIAKRGLDNLWAIAAEQKDKNTSLFRQFRLARKSAHPFYKKASFSLGNPWWCKKRCFGWGQRRGNKFHSLTTTPSPILPLRNLTVWRMDTVFSSFFLSLLPNQLLHSLSRTFACGEAGGVMEWSRVVLAVVLVGFLTKSHSLSTNLSPL